MTETQTTRPALTNLYVGRGNTVHAPSGEGSRIALCGANYRAKGGAGVTLTRDAVTCRSCTK